MAQPPMDRFINLFSFMRISYSHKLLYCYLSLYPFSPEARKRQVFTVEIVSVLFTNKQDE